MPSTSNDSNTENVVEKLISETYRIERNMAKDFFTSKEYNKAIDIYSKCIYQYDQLLR